MQLIKLAIFTICFVNCAFSQQKTQIETAKNGLFIKSCERVATNMKSCVLCEDKELKKNCKTYTCDDFGQCEQFKLGSNTLKNIMAASTLKSIKGILKETNAFGTTDYYFQEGTIKTYISKVGNVTILENYSLPPSSGSSAKKTQIPQQSDKRKECINDCIKIGELCKSKCNGSRVCIQECEESRLACGRIACNGLTKMSILNVSTKSTSSLNTLKLF
ncbi:MAG: hypothetical protein WBO31_12320 [Saprospiraceae bacterium]|nr:hypothetical protein [Saprospiraceae bacterium]MBK9221191.1 hypothetical protein [Saprospiraceae bacterium]